MPPLSAGFFLKGNNMFVKGDKAPNFQTTTAEGIEISLDNLLKNGPVVLVFHRYVGCPICQMHAMELAKEYHQFQLRNTRLYIIMDSSMKRVRSFAEKKKLPPMFIPDPNRKLYDLYDVKTGGWQAYLSMPTLSAAAKATMKGHFQGAMKGNMRQLPADFVIGTDGVFKFVHYGEHFADHTPVNSLLLALYE